MDHFKFYGSARIGSKGQVVIPAEAREELAIKEGDNVVIMKAPFHDGVMVLRSEVFEKHMEEMQLHINQHSPKRKSSF